MFNFNIPTLSNNQKIRLLIAFLLMFCFVFIPGLKGEEPNEIVFVVVWFVAAICLFTVLLEMFGSVVQKKLPYKYGDLKLRYGIPLKSFKTYVYNIGDVRFRGFTIKFDVYDKAIIVSYWKNAYLIEDFSHIKFKKEFCGYTCTIEDETTHIECHLSDRNYEYISNCKL